MAVLREAYFYNTIVIFTMSFPIWYPYRPNNISSAVQHLFDVQWQHQRSKGARSFRGQIILQPGHPDALFSSKKLTTIFLVVALKTQAANAVSPSK